MDVNEAERLRISDAEDDDRLSRLPDQSDLGTVNALAQTVKVTTYPTAAGAYYAVKCLKIFGTEAEGGAGTITQYGRAFYALNIGSAVTPLGTTVQLTFVETRWTFRYDG